MSILMCNNIFDNWLYENISTLNTTPLKIQVEILVQNEYSEQLSNVEINIRDKSNFWVNFKNKRIYYSNNWTKIFDEKSNQLIIDIADKNLLKNISILFTDNNEDLHSECIIDEDVFCTVKYPEYGIYFDSYFNKLDSSLKKITHNYQMTTTMINKIKINKLQNIDKDYWDPNFTKSFIIDLRP